MHKLDALNRVDADTAASMLSPAVERAPEIARRVVERRPFRRTESLCEAIEAVLRALDEDQRVELFRAHPELSPDNPLAMTRESRSEQERFDLTGTDNPYRARLGELNARYTRKFGFPYITALVRHRDMESVLTEFEARLAADRASEIEAAIEQIAAVSAARVKEIFGGAAARGLKFDQTQALLGQNHET